MKKNDVLRDDKRFVLGTYARQPVIFVKGKGMTLTDIDGKKYLDFFPGWGVSNVGHCHPKVMAGVRDQIGKLIHLPNNYYHPQQAKLAREIIRHAFPGKVFFCNSGAEACEAAIKMARSYGQQTGDRFEIITMRQSFHGRTIGALAATGQPKYQEGFGPLPPGFNSVPFNDIQAVKRAVTPRTVAVMLEPILGEGGVHVAQPDFVAALRAFCDDHDLLLIMDEVQTGMGRTGKMFGHQHYNCQPDLMTLAKALGGGLPIGALIVTERLADVWKPGMHASTFGGGPLVCKAALGVFKAIQNEKMLRNAVAMGIYLSKNLLQMQKKFDCIAEVRGRGLMIGIELTIPGTPVVDGCLQQGVLINCTQGNVLRLMPALNVTQRQCDKALHVLAKTIRQQIAKKKT